MVSLIQYVLAIIVVILLLAGFAFLSLRLHTREEILRRPKQQVQLQDIDDLPIIDKPPKRSLLDIFRRRERSLGG